MSANNKDAYGFTLVAIGLLTGFFLGAGLVYLFTNHEVTDQLAERTLERIGRIIANEPEADLEDQDKHQRTATLSDGIPDRLRVASESGEFTMDQSQMALHITDSASDLRVDDDLLTHTDQEAEEVSHQGKLAYSDDPDNEDYYITEDIRISRDRLLGVKSFILPSDEGSNPDSEGSRILDSLIGGRHQNPDAKRLLYVEFWESPLNYSVYKLARNRLILFGINQIDQISLLSHDGTLFLKYNEQYFILEQSSDFSLLQPESNVERIRKLDYSWP